MKLQDLLDSGYVGKSVIKIEGRGSGSTWTAGTKLPGVDGGLNLQRKLELSQITGKTIWMIWKCVVACREFMGDIIKKKSPEAVKIGSYTYIDSVVDYYRIDFDEGFSIYCDYWPGSFGGVNDVFIDTKEVVFPSKKKITSDSLNSRVYVLSLADTDFHYYLLPYLNYPKSMKPFLKYLEKEGKIKKGCRLWNKDEEIYTPASGTIDILNWWHNVQREYGAPMRNIKTLDDLDCYNAWLKDTVIPDIAGTKANYKSTAYSPSLSIVRLLYCPSEIKVETIDLTQADIDEYIKEANLGGIS